MTNKQKLDDLCSRIKEKEGSKIVGYIHYSEESSYVIGDIRSMKTIYIVSFAGSPLFKATNFDHVLESIRDYFNMPPAEN